jgi:AcrR family transcriptional regulator
MPAPVDHDARRRDLAARACTLIARGGLEAVTYRRLAADAECSTSIVTHYFADRHELLLWSYRVAADRSQERFDAAFTASDADLIACLTALLPVSPEVADDWRVYFAFWHTATVDPVLAREQRWWQRHCRQIIADLLRRRGTDAPVARRQARVLLTLVLGIAAQALFEERSWTGQRQRVFLAAQAETLLRAFA